MRVQVLDEAIADLADGFRFYEQQADGLGDYFLIHCGQIFNHCGFPAVSMQFTTDIID